MMIIKNGDIDKIILKISSPKIFTCGTCGCVFQLDKFEYKFIWYRLGYYGNCPCCGLLSREDTESYYIPEVQLSEYEKKILIDSLNSVVLKEGNADA